MTYLDGTTVKLGDLVWWDEENAIGRISDILETKEQCADCLGVEDPGVLICYDGSDGGLSTGYSRRAFDEDGIRPLTTEEKAEVERVFEAARGFSSEKAEDATTALRRVIKNDREYWNVVLYRNGQALQVIEVEPSDLSCREISLRESGLFYHLKSGSQ